jgi:hypothetical protein
MAEKHLTEMQRGDLPKQRNVEGREVTLDENENMSVCSFHME